MERSAPRMATVAGTGRASLTSTSQPASRNGRTRCARPELPATLVVSSRRLKRINTLRRVLLRMNFIEAMELLSEKLLDVEKTDDFLQRFEVDPEA